MRRMKFKNIIVLLIVLFLGCDSQDIKPLELPEYIFTSTCVIGKPSILYYNGAKKEIYLSKEDKKRQSIQGLLNEKDLLLMNETSGTMRGKVFCDYLYLVNVNMDVVDTIYSAKISNGESLYDAEISPNDSILFISLRYSRKVKSDKNDLHRPPLRILVMDFNKREITDSINIYSPDFIHYATSSNMFSPDGKQFVCSFSDKIFKNNLKNKKKGIYIYNLQQKKWRRIIDKGNNPIWSPNGNIIAYSTNAEIWFYNVKSNKKTLFYKAKDKQSVIDIIWTPDGKGIHLSTRKESLLYHGGIKSYRIININDKMEMTGKELNKLGLSFFWK